MNNVHLSDYLDPPEQALFRLKQIRQFTHPQKIREFFTSRLLIEKHTKVPWDNIRFDKSFQFIEGNDDLRVSLSHCKNKCALWAEDKNLHQSIGLDIEENERTPSIETMNLIRNQLDENLPTIEIWCAKEAALKCLTGAGFNDIRMSHISIAGGKFGYHSSGGEYKVNYVGENIIVQAWMNI